MKFNKMKVHLKVPITATTYGCEYTRIVHTLREGCSVEYVSGGLDRGRSSGA